MSVHHGKAHKHPPRPKRETKPRGKDRVAGSRVKDPVPVAPLRDYYLKGLERGDFTVCDLARNLGWYRGATTRTERGLDTTRVQRMLGVKGYSPGLHKNGKRYGAEPRELVSYATAVLLCRAMGAAPVDMVDPGSGEPIL